MKTVILLLIFVSAGAQASCFSLYKDGSRVYQDQHPPFDVSTGSPELAAAEAKGMRLVISPNETCGGDDYAAKLQAARQAVSLQHYTQAQQPAFDPELLRQIRPMGAVPPMPYALPPAPINPTFAERGEYRRMVRAMTGQPEIHIHTGTDAAWQLMNSSSDTYNTSRIVNAIERSHRW